MKFKKGESVEGIHSEAMIFKVKGKVTNVSEDGRYIQIEGYNGWFHNVNFVKIK